MPLVFQYGSNCDASRINSVDRLAGVARQVGCSQTVEGFELAFDVWSQTNRCAAADLIEAPHGDHRVWGVLYEIPEGFIPAPRTDGRKTLEQIEGASYEERSIRVRNQAGEEVEATTFVVRPDQRCCGLWTSAEYVGHVVKGLREHDVPDEYVQHVIDVAIQTNETSTRDSPTAKGEIPLIRQLREGGNTHEDFTKLRRQ